MEIFELSAVDLKTELKFKNSCEEFISSNVNHLKVGV